MSEALLISEIRLRNFKAFKRETIFPLSRINLLTGINGKGKSSMLQSLLLLRQTMEHDPNAAQIYLNGSCDSLGTFHDVRHSENRPTDEIFICVQQTQQGSNRLIQKLECNLSENPNDNRVLFFQYRLTGQIGKASKALEKEKSWPKVLCEFGFDRIHYISADRLGPQDTYPKSNFGQFINVGKIGEFTGNVLLNKKDLLVHKSLHIHEKQVGEMLIKDIDATLLTQVGYWLSEVLDTPNVKVLVEDTRADFVILLFKFGNQERDFKPANVGFGYSYILPIVVSGLIAQPGEILIVENPEAHLHPRAQSRLTHFLCKVASCGVQVFVESHSEHILNALRVAAIKEDSQISHTDISVLYFQNGIDLSVTPISINADGSIHEWPEGFFDQTDKDFKILFGF